MITGCLRISKESISTGLNHLKMNTILSTDYAECFGFTPEEVERIAIEDLIRNDYYYVDKTMLVKQVLDLKGKVNLFTRPRRFGKTLNLSMLRYFLKIQEMRQKMLPRENYLMD